MEQYLGRLLMSDETVDHIDGDFTNNNLDNLQVLFRKEHCKLDAKRNEVQWLLCGVCGKASHDIEKYSCSNIVRNPMTKKSLI